MDGMNYSERISAAINKLPSNLALKVGMDIDKRISDWLSAGGKEEDPYIFQQVRFAENAATAYQKEMN